MTKRPVASGGPSPHLSWSELACNDGTPYPHEWWVTRALPLSAEFEEIRRRCGDRPILVSSAYRTQAYNSRVGGASRSQHPEGRALDLTPGPGLGLIRLYEQAYAVAVERKVIRGIALYPSFVHIDIRPSVRLVQWGGKRPVPEVTR